MPKPEQTPTFNLKAVVQETGLKPDTLRAWERRYGLPQPERTAGGHRLYSQRDIDVLKWLVARQQEGLSISRAVDLWRTMAAEGQDPLETSARASPQTAGPGPLPAEGDALVKVRQSWLSACLAFDEHGANLVLNQAFALYPVETVCLELLQKGLAHIGQGWYEGEITVQQEHFASELATRRLEALLAASPPPTRPGRILTGCPPEEAHAFSPLLLTFFLRRKSWEVLFLGANVPIARSKATAVTINPHIVILIAQQLPSAATLFEASQSLRETSIALAFGGLIFNRLPALRSIIPGHFLGEQLEKAPQLVERWLTSPGSLSPLPATEPVGEPYLSALVHYREQQGSIETETWRQLRQADLSPAHLAAANKYLARNIIAALTLGDLRLLNADIEWVATLLKYHNLPAGLLSHYLELYGQAAQRHLDERGQVIIDWLAQPLDVS